jgi:hypothetical protein
MVAEDKKFEESDLILIQKIEKEMEIQSEERIKLVVFKNFFIIRIKLIILRIKTKN